RGFRRADWIRRADRSARLAAHRRARQPDPRAGGPRRRCHLPARGRHPGSQCHRAGRAVRPRPHRAVPRAVLHLFIADALPGRFVSALVDARGVTFAYPGADRRGRELAVADVSFAVAAGEILGVIGPNSAGKTTLIRLLTKVLAPLRGEISLDGVSLASLSRWELARHVAVVPQDVPPALPFTVEQLVLLGRYPHGPRRFFETPADRAA